MNKTSGKEAVSGWEQNKPWEGAVFAETDGRLDLSTAERLEFCRF